jgi:hypothetical protein
VPQQSADPVACVVSSAAQAGARERD